MALASVTVATMGPLCPLGRVSGALRAMTGGSVSRVTLTDAVAVLPPLVVATATSVLSPSSSGTPGAVKENEPAPVGASVAGVEATVTTALVAMPETVPVTSTVCCRVSSPGVGLEMLSTGSDRSTETCREAVALFPALSVATTLKV